VEEPSYYFDPSNPDRLEDLDLLLLTQGWRDFKWKYKTNDFLPEHGFSISGRVRKKLVDAALKNSTITLAIFKGGNPLIEILPLNSEGKFVSEKFDLTGEAKLVASVTGEKDNLKGWLLLDSIAYTPAPVKEIKRRANLIQNDQISSDNQLVTGNQLINVNMHKFIQYAEFKSSIQKKYRLSDTISLGEVNVIAKRVDWTESARSRSRHYLMGTPDREIVITPGMEIYNNAVQLLTSRFIISPFKFPYGLNRRIQNPLYMIDGTKATKGDIMALPITSIERIDVIDDPASFAALRTLTEIEVTDSLGITTTTMGYADGAISIILKDSFNSYINKSVSHSVNIKLSGYNEPRLFYSPKHKSTLESDYKPDLRTTLFWVPNITLEANRELLLDFYNSDNSSAIKITVEGITSTGIPVSGTTEYKVQ
jgi:hypothetical protein